VNATYSLELLFIWITPAVFISCLASFYFIFKKNAEKYKLAFLFFCSIFFFLFFTFEGFVLKNSNAINNILHYLIILVPISSILGCYAIKKLSGKNNIVFSLIFALLLISSAVFSPLPADRMYLPHDSDSSNVRPLADYIKSTTKQDDLIVSNYRPLSFYIDRVVLDPVDERNQIELILNRSMIIQYVEISDMYKEKTNDLSYMLKNMSKNVTRFCDMPVFCASVYTL